MEKNYLYNHEFLPYYRVLKSFKHSLAFLKEENSNICSLCYMIEKIFIVIQQKCP